MNKTLTNEADAVSRELDADVFLFRGEISRSSSENVERLLSKRLRKPNALLILVTPGGDPDAAFRIGRAFQDLYTGVVASLIPGWCKSAGTLITLAGSKIYIGDMGELGPLDIQLAKQDEIEEAASGLLIETTLRTLEATATRMFLSITKTIRNETRVTTKMASEISAKMVIGLMGPVYGQVEPLRVGENARAMAITMQYGRRLSITSKCLNDPASLEYLIRGYPDHGFVIDRKEAKSIYKDVEKPTGTMTDLMAALGPKVLYPPPSREPGEVEYLSTELGAAKSPINASKGAKSRVQSPRKARGSRVGGGPRPPSTIGAGAKGRAHSTNGSGSTVITR